MIFIDLRVYMLSADAFYSGHVPEIASSVNAYLKPQDEDAIIDGSKKQL